MNIYITKDNERFLQALKPKQSMSGTINNLLDDYRKKKAYNFLPLRETEKNKPTLVIEDDILENGIKPCKHGADPKFCRFAKPGKPCK